MNTSVESIATPSMWAGFIVFVLFMLALDLWVFGGKKAHRVSAREALAWVIVWMLLAFSFAGLMYWVLLVSLGADIALTKTLEFITGYLIEQSLSIDNMFVFIMIFDFFAVPAQLQRRVLLFGVLGAMLMRAFMILAGVWLVSQFEWLLYVFGAFLLITGLKIIIFSEQEANLEKNPLLKFLRKRMRLTSAFHDEKFFVRQNGLLWATPLFLVLVFIELSDVVFALDSIPAIFSITSDPFIIFTSNMFAIMGLRALYFLLADIAKRFHLLKYGLAVVLMFIGSKMIIVPWYHIPVEWSLAIVALLLISSVLASLLIPPNQSPNSPKKAE